MSTLRKSYSLSDLTDQPDMAVGQDEVNPIVVPTLLQTTHKPTTTIATQMLDMTRSQRAMRSRPTANRSVSASMRAATDEDQIYFSEIDIAAKTKETNLQ